MALDFMYSYLPNNFVGPNKRVGNKPVYCLRVKGNSALFKQDIPKGPD